MSLHSPLQVKQPDVFNIRARGDVLQVCDKNISEVSACVQHGEAFGLISLQKLIHKQGPTWSASCPVSDSSPWQALGENEQNRAVLDAPCPATES